jgi:carbonic anhydrase/acetyltransferase-like protein (isoleucine patch superfamily)
MIVTHRGHTPTIHPTATIAPTAVVAGNVTIGPGVHVLWGAVLTAEDGAITVGEDVLVMENAVVRARAGHDVSIGSATLIGPHSHVNGATIGKGCFVATGASLFPGARLGNAVEVRIRGVVQVNSWLDDGAIVPIHWVAVGRPAKILSPDRHEEIWAIQRDLDFPGTVYGVERGTPVEELMRQQSAWYEAHRDDVEA